MFHVKHSLSTLIPYYQFFVWNSIFIYNLFQCCYSVKIIIRILFILIIRYYSIFHSLCKDVKTDAP